MRAREGHPRNLQGPLLDQLRPGERESEPALVRSAAQSLPARGRAHSLVTTALGENASMLPPESCLHRAKRLRTVPARPRRHLRLKVHRSY